MPVHRNGAEVQLPTVFVGQLFHFCTKCLDKFYCQVKIYFNLSISRVVKVFPAMKVVKAEKFFFFSCFVTMLRIGCNFEVLPGFFSTYVFRLAV